jgi:hypothetical protein
LVVVVVTAAAAIMVVGGGGGGGVDDGGGCGGRNGSEVYDHEMLSCRDLFQYILPSTSRSPKGFFCGSHLPVILFKREMVIDHPTGPDRISKSLFTVRQNYLDNFPGRQDGLTKMELARLHVQFSYARK